MKLEDWEEALDGWEKFNAQMLIDVEKTEFYIKMLKQKISEVKNGE